MNKSVELTPKERLLTEYLVVTDRDSKVLMSTVEYPAAVRFANLMRKAGGEVTIFKSLKS